MNHLILNRDFRLPDDGWYHIAPLGEFSHTGAGVIQVIDQEACIAMAARFAADANTPNFPGLLIDFDHFSLDGEKRSEAAGWILGLEYIGTNTDQTDETDTNREGLWAQIRWSDLGEEAVKGGRYRFLSPVWARSDCVDLGDGRVRPVRILNAAVTNDPNLKGMVPLSNRSQESEFRSQNASVVDSQSLNRQANNQGDRNMKAVIEKLVNHLGLAADATEALILEKMGGLLTVTAVTDLQNSLTALQGKYDGLIVNLKAVEGELVNRHLADFEGVISEVAKPFWAEQLVSNRAGALAALGDLRDLAGKEEAPPTPGKETTRKPLHNRATARPVPPDQGNASPSTGSGSADGLAVKIRNRAHEIAGAEKIPFGVAFRRAEREVIGQ
jgi:phage I-like protein